MSPSNEVRPGSVTRSARFWCGLLTVCVGVLFASPGNAEEPTVGRASDALVRAATLGGSYSAAAASPLERMSELEQQLLETVLEEHGLELTRFPDGKPIRRIVIANVDVITEEDPIFPMFLNWFHATTDEDIIRERLLFEPGDTYSEERIEEARRHLSDPILFTTVLVAPVVADDPSMVDVLVITKDLWSLRLNSNWQLTGSHLDYLAASISENNLFGWNKYVAAALLLEPDVYSIGPSYLDKQLFGTRLRFVEAVKFSFNRDDSSFEGAYGMVSLSQPLYSLEVPWGWRVAAEFRHVLERRYSAGQLLSYPWSEEPDGTETMPWLYRNRVLNATASVTRALSRFPGESRVQHQLTWGWWFGLQQPEVPDSGRYSATLVETFEREVLPRSQRDSYPFVAYRTYEPRYRSLMDVETLGLREDFQLGHDLELLAGVGHPFTGSELAFAYTSANASYRLDIAGDDLALASASIASRFEGGRWLETLISGAVRYSSPVLLFARLHVAGRLGMHIDDPSNTIVALGGDNGLRGFHSAQFFGAHSLRVNVEVRTIGLRVFSTLFGLVAYWDGGGAFDADDFSDLRFHNGTGIGLRWLVPQFDRVVVRLDWGFPLDTIASFPGRLSLGFEQAF